MSGWAQLERFLRTDPADVGCGETLAMLHVYVDLVLADDVLVASTRYAGIAAHLLACGPCADDYTGLLAAAGEVPSGHDPMA